MTGRDGDGRDLQLALITATLLCAAPAASLIHRLDLPPAPGSPIAKWSVAIGASAITAALVSHRLITVRRVLSSRTTLAVVPADELTIDPRLVRRWCWPGRASSRYGWCRRILATLFPSRTG